MFIESIAVAVSFLVVSEQDRQSIDLCDFLLNMGYCVQKTCDHAIASEILDSDPSKYYGIFLNVCEQDSDRQKTFESLKNKAHCHNFPVFLSKKDYDILEIKQSLEKLEEYESVILFDNVNQLQAKKELNEKIEEQIKKRKNMDMSFTSLNGTLNYGKFNIQSIEQAQLLARQLASHCPKTDVVVIGLSELMINAIEHGNLHIDYDKKSELHAQGKWYEEVQRLLKTPEYKNKHATVEFIRAPGMITIQITDQGDGFNWRDFEQVDPRKMLDSHGRGIIIARALSFETLTYNEKGNQVTCTILTDK